jgi:hypothetical protein
MNRSNFSHGTPPGQGIPAALAAAVSAGEGGSAAAKIPALPIAWNISKLGVLLAVASRAAMGFTTSSYHVRQPSRNCV